MGIKTNLDIGKEETDNLEKAMVRKKGEKISKSSLVNDWICTNVKNLEL